MVHLLIEWAICKPKSTEYTNAHKHTEHFLCFMNMYLYLWLFECKYMQFDATAEV